jgi:aerobic-type carbon monoxide dehydrogenase small subunit (CoxS/CutS family)
MRVSFRINGDPVMVDVEPRLHLADCLRDVLGLTEPISAASMAPAGRARSSSTAPRSAPA